MNRLAQLFGRPFSPQRPYLVGMLHLPPLPGTPRARRPFCIQELIDRTLSEVEIYNRFPAIDGLLIENMADLPYLTPTQVRRDGAQQQHLISVATRIAVEVKSHTSKPCGIQLLAGLNEEALSVAVAASLQFIRAEAFAYGHLADEGLLMACAGPLLRYRALLDASDKVSIWADVKKKHSSHAISADLSLGNITSGTLFCGADGIIITGSETGQAPKTEDVRQASKSMEGTETPVIVGSGVTDQNWPELIRAGAHLLIVGSFFKQDSKWNRPLDADRIKSFCQQLT